MQGQLKQQTINKVQIYLRNVNSQSIKLAVKNVIMAGQFFDLIQKMMDIPADQQILYFAGKRIKNKHKLRFKENSIVHVKDRRKFGEQMIVKLVKHQPQNKSLFKFSHQIEKVEVKETDTIQSFLQKIIKQTQISYDIQETKLVQSGRILKATKTFREQNIQSQSQIHIIYRQSKHNQKNQNTEDNEFIDSVIKITKNNQSCLRIDQSQDNKLQLSKNQSKQSLLPDQFEEFRPSLNLRKISNPQTPSQRHSLKSLVQHHTISSQKWIRGKYRPSNLKPFKLGLTDYQKVQGVLSAREYSCKLRMKSNICNSDRLDKSDVQESLRKKQSEPQEQEQK